MGCAKGKAVREEEEEEEEPNVLRTIPVPFIELQVSISKQPPTTWTVGLDDEVGFLLHKLAPTQLNDPDNLAFRYLNAVRDEYIKGTGGYHLPNAVQNFMDSLNANGDLDERQMRALQKVQSRVRAASGAAAPGAPILQNRKLDPSLQSEAGPLVPDGKGLLVPPKPPIAVTGSPEAAYAEALLQITSDYDHYFPGAAIPDHIISAQTVSFAGNALASNVTWRSTGVAPMAKIEVDASKMKDAYAAWLQEKKAQEHQQRVKSYLQARESKARSVYNAQKQGMPAGFRMPPYRGPDMYFGGNVMGNFSSPNPSEADLRAAGY